MNRCREVTREGAAAPKAEIIHHDQIRRRLLRAVMVLSRNQTNCHQRQKDRREHHSANSAQSNPSRAKHRPTKQTSILPSRNTTIIARDERIHHSRPPQNVKFRPSPPDRFIRVRRANWWLYDKALGTLKASEEETVIDAYAATSEQFSALTLD